MDDTDQLLRVTTPFIRPGLESLEPMGQLDRTPTTAPGNTPGTPRRRLARGTMAPPVEVLKLEATALPVRLIDPPKRWSYRVRVDLAETFYSLPPVSGEIDTAPVRRVGETPWGAIIALGSAAAIVLAAIWVVLNAGSTDSAGAAAPAAAATSETVVVALPAEPAEIEMPAHEVTPAAASPAPTYATLMIGSKPPCRILIDGKDTGLTTPNRAVRVPAGRHTITLVNDELGIRYSEALTITGGRKAKMIRDLTKHIDG